MRLNACVAGFIAMAVSSGIEGQSRENLARLESAEAKWASASLQTYEYTVSYESLVFYLDCESGSFRVRVRNGVPENLSGCESFRALLGTVPGLFRYVRELLSETPSTVKVSFDPEFGFPTALYGYSARTDDAFRLDVTEFRAPGKR